jgi:Subtilase family
VKEIGARADDREVGRCAVLAFSFLALAYAGPAAASGTILVKFAHPAGSTATVDALGDDLLWTTAGRVAVVDPAPGESVADALADYRARPDVVYAEANRTRHLLTLGAPDDPDFGLQWGLAKVNALGGWSLFPGTFSPAASAPIGIVDTGVDAAHTDLASRVSASSATCVGGCTAGVPSDPAGHGTHVSGVAGAATNNGIGVAGVSFASPLIAVRVFYEAPGGGWTTTDAEVASGILWAAQHGAKAINLSLGGTGYSPTLCNAVTQAILTYHAVVVAAAGNSAVASPTYPAACPGAIGVAATDAADNAASFSNFGSPNVFVSAPGVDVLSTYPGQSYLYASGTSVSAPFVTGLAALIVGRHPGVSVAAVRQLLAQTADKVGTAAYATDPYGTCAGCTWEPHHGYGRVDALRALATPLPPPPPGPPPPPPPPPPGSPPSARDTTAPAVRVYGARGRRGILLRLRYRVRDNRGRTSERISIYRRKRLLGRTVRPLRLTDDAVAYRVRWRFRRAGAYRFCVRAADSAGNHTLACARVRVG